MTASDGTSSTMEQPDRALTNGTARPEGSTGWRVVPFLLPPLALTLVVYWPTLGCYFAGDDWFHLQDLVNDPLPKFLLKPYAGHVYIVRNAIFALTHHVFAMQPEPYFVSVLLTHLLNVALLFAFIGRRCGARIACVGATLWGTSPLHDQTIGWYSVYGQALVGLLMLLVLNDVARVDGSRAPVRLGRALAWGLILLTACTCFGVGLGIAAAFPIAAWTILGSRLSRGARAVLMAMPAAVVALYAGVMLLYATLYDRSGTVQNLGVVSMLRDWRSVLATLAQLPPAGVSELVTMVFTPRARYPEPALLAIGATWAVAYVLALLTVPRDVARWLRALGILALGGYTVVALGRGPIFALLSGTGVAAAEPRYHYVGSLLLVAILCLMLVPVAARVSSARLGTALALGAVAVIGVGWWRSGWIIDQHTKERTGAMLTVKALQRVRQTTLPNRVVYVKNRRIGPPWFRSLFVGTAATYAIFFPDDRPYLYFVEPDPVTRSSVPAGSRIARSLVPFTPIPITPPVLQPKWPGSGAQPPAPTTPEATSPATRSGE